MAELWKSVPLFESKYEISSYGNVRSITREVRCKGGTRMLQGRILKQQINHRGYAIIALSTGTTQKTFTVHQLMAMTFMDDFIKGTQVNHIDGNPLNNRLDNLEVSNPSHNQFHAVSTGLRRKLNSSKFHNVYYISNPKAKRKWMTCIRHEGKNIGYKCFFTEEEAAYHADELLDQIGDINRLRNFS